MRKILTKCFSLVAMLACIVTLASCVVSSNTSIQINKFPEATYAKGDSSEEALNDIIVTISDSGTAVTGNLNKLQEKHGVKVENFDLSQDAGTYTAKISYRSATITFTYTIADSHQTIGANNTDELYKLQSEKVYAFVLGTNVTITQTIVVPKDAKVVLDLAQFSLSTESTDTELNYKYLFEVKEGAKLEVVGSGSIINNNVNNYGIFNVSGELVVSNGTFTDYSQTFNVNEDGDYERYLNDYNELQSHRGSLLMINKEATLTIYGGTFEAKKPANLEEGKPYGKPVLYLHENSSTKIYDGDFSNDSADNEPASTGAYVIHSVGNLFVYGGTFTGDRGALACIGGTFDVRGGKFHGELHHGAYITGKYAPVSGLISGGEFSGKSSGLTLSAKDDNYEEMDSSTLTVTGGKFSSLGFSQEVGAIATISVKGGFFKAIEPKAIHEDYELSTTADSEDYKEVVKK